MKQLTIVLICLFSCFGCDNTKEAEESNQQVTKPTTPAIKPAPDMKPVIIFFGNSLTAGYGIDPEQAYPALIQTPLRFVGLQLFGCQCRFKW